MNLLVRSAPVCMQLHHIQLKSDDTKLDSKVSIIRGVCVEVSDKKLQGTYDGQVRITAKIEESTVKLH